MTLAEKAFAYGFEGVQVDGNDLFAVYAAVSQAAQTARTRQRPVLIEGYTYRLGAHTTADDPRRYRDDAEVERWKSQDPLVRLEKYLSAAGLLTEQDRLLLREQAVEEARRSFEETERTADPTCAETFLHTFATLPPLLAAQLKGRNHS
jgi:pyruvate dehydrogenase E1 component alpha subunit